MIKLLGLLSCVYYSLDGGFHFPRLVHNNVDFILMPLIGYLLILLLPWCDHLIEALIRQTIKHQVRNNM